MLEHAAKLWIFASRKAAKAQRQRSIWKPGSQEQRELRAHAPARLVFCGFAALRETLLVVLVLLSFCGKGLAATPPPEFDAANRLFDQGDFQGARSGYDAVVESGHWSANLFYNLGNAEFRLGNKSAAILDYERALVLEPAHPEATANLNLLRGETGAKLPSMPWYGRALSKVPANEAAWIASAAFFGLCLSLIPRVWKRRAATLPAAVCALALIWSTSVVGWHASRGETWIVTADEAKARTTPADNSPAAAALPMGSRVRLLLERGPWLQMQLPDGSAGWISRDAVQPIRLARK